MYGNVLKKARVRKNITQVELGKRVGKSKQWISEIERDNIRLGLDAAVRLAGALETSLDIFLPKRTTKVGLHDAPEVNAMKRK